ncbi:hypothetical protein ACQP3J_33185, partial [Escherichia coli]
LKSKKSGKNEIPDKIQTKSREGIGFTRSNFKWKGSHASKCILLDYSNIWMGKGKPKLSPLPRCLIFVMPSR